MKFLLEKIYMIRLLKSSHSSSQMHFNEISMCNIQNYCCFHPYLILKVLSKVHYSNIFISIQYLFILKFPGEYFSNIFIMNSRNDYLNNFVYIWIYPLRLIILYEMRKTFTILFSFFCYHSLSLCNLLYANVQIFCKDFCYVYLYNILKIY